MLRHGHALYRCGMFCYMDTQHTLHVSIMHKRHGAAFNRTWCIIHLCVTGSLEAAPRPISEPVLPNGQPTTRQAEAKLSATAQFQMEATLQKDAFLVFRALCKLSVRASETATGTDMTAIRGKVSHCTHYATQNASVCH